MSEPQNLNGQVLDRDWLTIDEAAARLEKSTKTVDRLVKAELIRTRLESRTGRRPERLYSATDVDRAREGAYVAGAALAQAQTTSTAVARNHPTVSKSTKSDESVGDGNAARPVEYISIATRYWLTLGEAAAMSGLSKALIRREARSGRLEAFRDVSWKVARESLASWKPTALPYQLARSMPSGKAAAQVAQASPSGKADVKGKRK